MIQELGDFPSESWGNFTKIFGMTQHTLTAHQMKAKNITEGSLVQEKRKKENLKNINYGKPKF